LCNGNRFIPGFSSYRGNHGGQESSQAVVKQAFRGIRISPINRPRPASVYGFLLSNPLFSMPSFKSSIYLAVEKVEIKVFSQVLSHFTPLLDRLDSYALCKYLCPNIKESGNNITKAPLTNVSTDIII